MVKDEVEPLGGFIGDAFVQPALLGGQAATALVFIVVQNFWLGAIAVAIVAVQGVLIPRMRRRLIRLGRERQLTARELSGRVGEIVDGIGTIHVHDTSNFERADISARLGTIFQIRYDLYQWKFLVKFINNFLAQVTPFLFYSIGGYQALKGNLDIGQLVAVIAAYKDLPGPLKDLIDWDQARQDVQVKYQQVVEQFSVDTIIDPKIQTIVIEHVGPITEPLGAVNLSLADDSGARLLERVSLQTKPGETVALVGTAASGAESLAEAFARQIWPESGRLVLGEQRPSANAGIDGRAPAVLCVVRRILLPGHARRQSVLRSEACAVAASPEADSPEAKRAWDPDEARLSGNPEWDIRSDWIDYEAAGATGPHDLITVDPAGARRDDAVAGHHRPGAALLHRARAASRAGRADRRVAIGAARAARARESQRPGRAVRTGNLQSRGDDRRKPALRHGQGTGAGRQGAGDKPLYHVRAQGSRPRRDALRHGPGDRLQRHRAVRRPAAGQPAVPAAHLHDAGGNPGLPDPAAEIARAANMPTPRPTTAPGSSR